MDKQFGLRERKKGLLKLSLIEALLDALSHDHFDDIKVKDLCDVVNISEVTFFKYFERKEELLQYYMQVWNYEREVRIYNEGRKRGLEGIYAVFNDISVTANVIAILNTQAVFISRCKVRPDPIILTPCERWLIDNEHSPKSPLGLSEQFNLHLQEAIEDGYIPEDISITDCTMLLSSLFYGGSLMAHATGMPIKEHYQHSLKIIFRR